MLDCESLKEDVLVLVSTLILMTVLVPKVKRLTNYLELQHVMQKERLIKVNLSVFSSEVAYLIHHV